MTESVEIAAHRGDSRNFPENTLPAIESALNAGVPWIEVDVRDTLDGCLVLCHDPITARLADRTLFISRSTYEQLSRLDFAHGFRGKGLPGSRGAPNTKIAKLEEALETVRDHHAARISLHCKTGNAGAVVKLVRNLRAADCVAYNGLLLSKLRHIQTMEPSAHLIWDRWPWSIPQWDIPAAQRLGVKDYIMHRMAVTASRAARLSGAGLRPGAWTVNDASGLARLVSLGVRKIYTDDPYGMKEHLTYIERGAPLASSPSK